MNEVFSPSETKFNVSEIFFSIQGEGLRAGMPCVFVRFQGCELRCSWCDTDYALEIKHIETMMTGKEILEKVVSFNCRFVTFTGGEPLLQNHSRDLISFFCESDFLVAVETNGHQDISKLDKRAIRIMDLKCPLSGMEKKNNYQNINFLTTNDEVKFVIAGLEDYNWAKTKVQEYRLDLLVAAIHFSPVTGKVSPQELAEWILRDNLPVRFQLQLHKYIWSPDKRGV